jgi:hypothetical protein
VAVLAQKFYWIPVMPFWAIYRMLMDVLNGTAAVPGSGKLLNFLLACFWFTVPFLVSLAVAFKRVPGISRFVFEARATRTELLHGKK